MTTSRRPSHLLALFLLTLLVSHAHAQKVPFEGKEQSTTWAENRMGRFFQSNQWARLDELSRNALDVAIKNNLAGLKTQAQWYRTLVVAQNGAKPEVVFAELEKTFDYGYRSVQGIESADQLAVLRTDPVTEPKFRELIERLKETVASEAKAKFESAVEQRIEKAKALEPSSLGVHAILKPGGQNAGEAGRPMVVVLSRTYHAGFRKQWPALERAAGPFAGRVTPLALFYENDAQSSFIQGEVARFAKATGVGEDNYAVIDREAFKRLRDEFGKLHEQLQQGAKDRSVFDLYFPFTFVVDGTGQPLFAASGNLTESEIAFALEKSLAGLPVPETSEEEEVEEADDGSADKEESAEKAADADDGAADKEEEQSDDEAADKEEEQSDDEAADKKEDAPDKSEDESAEQSEAADESSSASRVPDRTF